MKTGYFGGIEITIISELKNCLFIRMKNNGESYKAPTGTSQSEDYEIFCQGVEHAKHVRDALYSTVQELDKLIED